MENNKSVTGNGSTILVIRPYEQYMYIGFASAALFANLLISVVLITNKNFLKSSAFIVSLTLGDIVLSIGTAMAGVLRSTYINLHIENDPVHPFSCLLKFTSLLIVGVQLPSTMIFLIGIERITAVMFFQWYYKQWSNMKEWYLTNAGYLYCLISLAICWYIVGTLPEDASVSLLCGTAQVVRPTYSTYHFGVAVVSGCFSLLATIVSLLVFSKKRGRFISGNKSANGNTTDENKFVKKQCKLTQSAICLALSDFILVVTPNILLSIASYFPALTLLGTYATCLLCIRSTITLLIYLNFNREFKINFMKTFKCNLSNVVNTSTRQE